MISIFAMLLQAAATAPTATPTPAPAAAPAPAPWTVIVRGDAAAGNLSTSTYVLSRTPGSRLAIRCDARAIKVVSLQFRTDAGLGVGPVRPVRLTVDGGMPLIANWDFDHGVGVASDDVGVTTMVAAIAHAKRFNIHTVNLAGEPVDADFDGPPNADGLTKVLATCGYTLGVVPVRAPAAPAPQ